MSGPRLSWKETRLMLQRRGIALLQDNSFDPREQDSPLPGQRCNPYLLNATHQEVEFANLTLRRILFEQCQFFAVSFANTDFLLSCASEGRFIDCDFSDAILICANLSGAYFFGCRFVNAQLVGAELRGANLENCNFTGADLTGARLDLHLKGTLALSEVQMRRMVDWRSANDQGPDEEEDESAPPAT